MIFALLREKKLPQILASFERTMNDLETLQDRNAATIDMHERSIAASKSARDQLEAESTAAAQIQENIKKLVRA